jgi:hypothetical protein
VRVKKNVMTPRPAPRQRRIKLSDALLGVAKLMPSVTKVMDP